VAVTPLRVAHRAGVPPADALSAALADLDGDLAELSFICAAAQERLARLDAELASACPYRQTGEVLARATASAQRRYRAVTGGVRLQGGSSFGFDTTRIYLAAARADSGTPFVRIAAGTEHRLELDALCDALGAALAIATQACG
jgi:hypothetical protein